MSSPRQSIEILAVEDNRADFDLVREMLRRAGDEFVLHHVTRLADAVQLLTARKFDLILTDLQLPDSTGIETFVSVQGAAEDVPIVILSSLADNSLALQALERGAQDCLVKGNTNADLLGRSLRYAITRHRLQSQIKKLRKDIQAAHHIQQHLLPAHVPQFRGFEIAGKCYPAEDCSGDFFDYIVLPSGRLCIVLADVSGHGLGPAILAAAIRSYLRTAAVLGNQVHEMLALGNRLLHSDGESTPFASVFAASLNPAERTFRFASAGHPAFLLRASGETSTLESMSVPIGVRIDEPFSLSSRFLFRNQDILLLVSDGVWEARSKSGEYFGLDRMLNTVRENRDERAATIVERLHDAAMEFAGRRSLEDDLTAVVVKVVDSPDEPETWVP